MEHQQYPLISVIVPVYNVEPYLTQCINSILKQKYKNFELLLVDDGSKDGSGDICDSYLKQDRRVRVFHKANGGVSSARNLGLNNADGKWVAFVDSDDIVTPDYLSDLYRYVNGRDDVDLVIEKFSVFQDGSEVSPERLKLHSTNLEEYVTADFRSLVVDNDLVINCQSFSKLFKLRIIRDNALRFPTVLSFAEDYYFVFNYLMHVGNKVVCADAANYFYRNRTGSLVKVGFGDFKKGYQNYVLIKELSLRFIVKYSLLIDDMDLAYFLHRTIMTAKNVSQLKSITSDDWNFFLQYFKVFTRKTRNDRWMISHFRYHPHVLLTYIKVCRSLRNSLARTNLWGILNALKK